MLKDHVISNSVLGRKSKYLLILFTLTSVIFVLLYSYDGFHSLKPIYDDEKLSIVYRRKIQKDKSLLSKKILSLKSCRQNTTELVDLMRSTQRHVNDVFKRTIHNNTERYEKMAMVFGSAMSSFRYILKPFRYYDSDENKYFLRFSHSNSSCNVITLGVGGYWEGQKSLRKMYPQCTMLGVDVVDNNRKRVESDPNSRYVSAFIAEKGGNYQKVEGVDVKVRTIVELLRTENKGKLVDFMTIDVEGAEYAIMDVLKKRRAELPVICQFNVEMHYSSEQFGVTSNDFVENIIELFDEAHFIALNVEERDFIYRKMFMINVGDEVCVKKFLC